MVPDPEKGFCSSRQYTKPELRHRGCFKFYKVLVFFLEKIVSYPANTDSLHLCPMKPPITTNHLVTRPKKNLR